MKNVINKIKEMNKSKKIMLVSILLSTILLIAGVSYAYYSATVKEVNKTQTVIKTNELEIIFTGTNEITASGIVPGESFEKTFTVENVSNIPVTYNIYLENITNEFDEDLVYTLTDDNGEVIAEEVLPSDSKKTYLITDVEIDAKELKTYTMNVEFKYTDKDQNHLQGASFKATLGVDTKKVTIVKVVNDKLNLVTMENGILTKNFIVKNLSETSQNYDIKLSDIINTYGDNLTYSLSKNGEEVITKQVMPSSDVTILEKQTLAGLTTDEYTMTIKAETKTAALDLIAETDDFSGKLIVDYEESGIEKTVSDRLALDTLEKGKSVTTNISVENTSNKTRTYAISLDDFIATYAEGLVYTVTKNGTTIIEITDLPTANKVMIENQEISAKKTDEYVITVTKEEGIVKTASKISTTSITAGNTKTVTLTVENKSSKNGTYNVSLSDFVSDYTSDLKYTLTKNGETITNETDMPTNNVALLSSQTIAAKEKDTYIITISKDGLICMRATELHTEKCLQSSSNVEFCRASGYAYNGVITYGNKAAAGSEPIAGDAYDCDVNGDHKYDSVTERFYYVTNMDEETAVLIYYSNVSDGIPDNYSVYAYETAGLLFPYTITFELPTTEQWSNVSLKNIKRNVTDENGKVTYANFSYKGYAARHLTYKEAKEACGVSLTEASYGQLDNCKFFMENTKFSNSNLIYGFWLESTVSGYNNYAWGLYGNGRYADKADITNTLYAGVRPVIEVPLTQLEK